MAVPRRYVERYRNANTKIKQRSAKKLEKALRAIDWSNITEGANVAVKVMNTYCAAVAQTSAALSAQFYDGLRERELGKKLGAEAYSGYSVEANEQAVRAFVQKIVDGSHGN